MIIWHKFIIQYSNITVNSRYSQECNFNFYCYSAFPTQVETPVKQEWNIENSNEPSFYNTQIIDSPVQPVFKVCKWTSSNSILSQIIPIIKYLIVELLSQIQIKGFCFEFVTSGFLSWFMWRIYFPHYNSWKYYI